MPKDVSHPTDRLTFEAARDHVVATLHATCGVLNDERIGKKWMNPTFDIDFTDLDMDSLAMIEAAMALENRTGLEIDVGDLLIHGSVNALSRLLVSKAGAE